MALHLLSDKGYRFPMRILLLWLLSLSLISTLPACQSKRKAEMVALEAKNKQLERAKAMLRDLLTSTTMTLSEKEQVLQEVKAMGLPEEELQPLLAQVEEKLKEERRQQAWARQQEEAKRAAEVAQNEKMNSLSPKLLDYFKRIATATDPQTANRLIDEVLTLFAGEMTPVLIVISNSGGVKDYDRPLTIRRYLDYIKDQRRNDPKVESILFNSAGRITELELLKK